MSDKDIKIKRCKLELETIRKGRIVAVKLKEDGKHPMDWDWYDGAFGLGWRTFAIFEDGLFRYVQLHHSHFFKMHDIMNPKKIRTTLFQSKYDKREQFGCSWGQHNYFVNLDNVYKIYFEDEVCKALVEVSSYNILNVLQPNTDNDKCVACWSYNPIAVFGTGYEDWSYPTCVNVFLPETEFVEDSKDWLHPYRYDDGYENRVRNLENLKEYTGIDFSIK